MAISIPDLKNALKAAFEAEKEQTENQDASIERITTAMARAIAEQVERGINTASIGISLTAAGVPVEGEITITTTTEE